MCRISCSDAGFRILCSNSRSEIEIPYMSIIKTTPTSQPHHRGKTVSSRHRVGRCPVHNDSATRVCINLWTAAPQFLCKPDYCTYRCRAWCDSARVRSSGKSRLANVSWLGNQKRYQANKESPVYHEFYSIVEKTVGFEDPIRSALEPLSDKIDLALLFGSVANQTDRATSDIDLMLISSELSLLSIYAVMESVERKRLLTFENEYRERQNLCNPVAGINLF